MVDNANPDTPYMFTTERYSLKFTIMSLWDLAQKSPGENGIFETSVDAPLDCSMILKAGDWFNCNCRELAWCLGIKKRAVNFANALVLLDKGQYI